MGCFNSVMISCPHCNKEVEEQTKEGSCILASYTLEDAPVADLIGVSNYPIECYHCKGKFVVKNQVVRKAWVEKYEDGE